MPTSTALIGRARELAALRALVRAVEAGQGGVAVVEGEAGIGKSRLVAEVIQDLRVPTTLRSGAADELSHDAPFRALADALHLDAGAGAEPSPGDGAPADVGFGVVESIVSHLELLASSGPVVLVLEDVHWADPSTLRALRAIGRATSSEPVLMVLTLRRFPHSHELDRLLDDLALSGATRVALGGLTDEEVRELAGAIGGTSASAHLGMAGGNPLHVIEIVSAVADAGLTGPVPLPPTLRATILRRVGHLPERAGEMLRVASVLGRRFPLDHLAAMMACTSVDLLGVLEGAMRAGVIGGAGDDLVFRHELVREALYTGLAPAVRRGLHVQAARLLGPLGAPLPTVAEHYSLGASVGDIEAGAWLARAAREAAPRSPATAVKLFERAIALTSPIDPAGDALGAELAPLLIQTGRAKDAEALSRALIARGPAPAVEASLRRALAEVLWTLGWLEPAVDELDAAAALAGAPEADRRGALALAASLLPFLGQPDEARRRAEALQREAEAAGDEFALCATLQTLAVVADAEGRVALACDLSERAVAVATRSTEPRVGHLQPHLYRGLVLLDADRPADAEAVLDAGRRRAEERGTTAWLPLYHCMLAIRRATMGELDDAVAECEVGLSLAGDVGTRLHGSMLHGVVAWVALQRGDVPQAQAGLEHAAEEFLAATSPDYRAVAVHSVAAAGARWPLEWGLWLQGLLHDAHGDPGPAAAAAADAWTVAAPLRYFLGYRLFAPDVVRLALQTGDRARAAAVTAEVELGARRAATASARGAALRCRGLLEGDVDALSEAVDCYRASPYAGELALTLDDAGTALAKLGRVEEATALLDEARALHERAGAHARTARTDAALRSLGVHRRRSRPAPKAIMGWDSLTSSELAVVRLAAEGLTNRQAGERLFVSRRTVETHLSHAFAKLGVSSRAQLAAEVGRRDVR